MLVFLVSVSGFSIHADAQIRYRKLSQETITSRVSSSPAKDAEREAKLKQLFAEAGCKDITEPAVKGQKLPNLVCILPGSSPKRIVVGAHFDHVDAGDGIVDNWSGTSLLPSLMESISAEPRTHTIVFVAFAAEEQGLVGSKFFVKSLSADERSAISAMINLDTLGLSSTKIWLTHADKGLAVALGKIAQVTNLPLEIVNVDNVGSADSESFREKKIPAITIHSVTQETWPILHSKKDKLEAIKLDDYYKTYQLLSAYIVMLDQGLDQPMPPAASAAESTKTQ
jgi:Zn-dependent M28 family amino/carboxypeptidase